VQGRFDSCRPDWIGPWNSSECSPRSHRGGRWFKSSRDYWTTTPVAKRRRHLPDVEELPQVRVLPGVLTAEWTGAWLPARSHKPFDAGSNPASAICRSGSVAAARRPGKRGRPGSTPGRTSAREWVLMDRGGESASHAPRDGFDFHRIPSPMNGPVVQRDDAGLACRQCGFDSRRVHSIRRVAGYGLPGRFAKPCGREAVRVRIPCLPLFGPGGETDIMPRF
jgi:hypothetical protein